MFHPAWSILVLAVLLIWQVEAAFLPYSDKGDLVHKKARDDLKVAASGTKPGIEGHAQT